MSQPARRPLICGCSPTPPKIDAGAQLLVRAVHADALERSAPRARASGASTSTRGPRPPAVPSTLQQGSTKAAVLPVPVWAPASRSRPASTGGMAPTWIRRRRVVAVRGNSRKQLRLKPEIVEIHDDSCGWERGRRANYTGTAGPGAGIGEVPYDKRPGRPSMRYLTTAFIATLVPRPVRLRLQHDPDPGRGREGGLVGGRQPVPAPRGPDPEPREHGQGLRGAGTGRC